MTKSAMHFAGLMPAGMQGYSPIGHLESRSSARSLASRKARKEFSNPAETHVGQPSLKHVIDRDASKASLARGGWCGVTAPIHREGAK